MAEIEGVGPEAEVVENEYGGKQSRTIAALHLLDPEVILALGKVLQKGEKYGRDNWRRISCEEHLNHALNHIFAALAGDTQDEHLEHALCRIHFAVAKKNDGSLQKAIKNREANDMKW